MLHTAKTTFSSWPWVAKYSKSIARTLRFLSGADEPSKNIRDKIIKSKQVLDRPIPEISFYEFVTAEFHEYGNKTALIDGLSGEKLSFTELHSLSHKFGSLLTKHGLKERDCVAIFSTNCIQYPPALFGNAGIGAVSTTVNPLMTKQELVNQLKDCNAKYLVTKKEFLDNARAAADLSGIERIILFDEPETHEDGVLGWKNVIEDDGSAFVSKKVVEVKDEILFLPYSSGTTGKSKGVMQTHYNLVSNIIMMENIIKQDEDMHEICLGLIPFYHIYGIALIISFNLWLGKTVVSLPRFEPETFLAAISDYKIDHVNLVPPLCIFLTKHPLVDKYDLTSMKTVTCGAAPFGGDAYTAFKEKFPNVDFISGYGMTETVIATICPSSLTDAKSPSVGAPIANTEMKVVDVDSGELLGPNQTGEIYIKNPSVMKGYLNNPEATAKCLFEDGWMASGDLGYYDEDDHFFIVDRLKELIKYKAHQVAPAELEDLLLSHPQVADVAVIGIPDNEAGELPRAYVVKKGDVTKEELFALVKENLAPQMKLRGGIEFLDVIPKTASGKLLRRVLKEKAVKNI